MAATATGPDPLPDAAARAPSGDPTSNRRAAKTELEKRPSSPRPSDLAPQAARLTHARPAHAQHAHRLVHRHTTLPGGAGEQRNGRAPSADGQCGPNLLRPDRRHHQPGAREWVDAAIARGPQSGMPRRRLSSRVPEGQRRERRDFRNRARVAGTRPGGNASPTPQQGRAGGLEAALDLRARAALGTWR
jgi:hypothetical protein